MRLYIKRGFPTILAQCFFLCFGNEEIPCFMCNHRVALFIFIIHIYIELVCTQSPFFQNLPYECTASVPVLGRLRDSGDIGAVYIIGAPHPEQLSKNVCQEPPIFDQLNNQPGSKWADIISM